MGTMLKLFALVCLFELAYCWKNYYDKPLHFVCHRNQVITRIVSKHSNRHEDRLYDFSCSNRGHMPNICGWRGYINDFDQMIGFICPNGGVVSGLQSYHSNHHEDRRWKVYCCTSRVSKPVNCKMTGWLNNWDQYFDYHVPPHHAIHGLFSYHDNKKEDRRWKLLICRF